MIAVSREIMWPPCWPLIRTILLTHPQPAVVRQAVWSQGALFYAKEKKPPSSAECEQGSKKPQGCWLPSWIPEEPTSGWQTLTRSHVPWGFQNHWSYHVWCERITSFLMKSIPNCLWGGLRLVSVPKVLAFITKKEQKTTDDHSTKLNICSVQGGITITMCNNCSR